MTTRVRSSEPSKGTDSSFKVAILGCGTVGGGVARILLDLQKDLCRRSGRSIELACIVDLFPAKAAERHGIPANLFAVPPGASLSALNGEQAAQAIDGILADKDIDLVVETIGGSSERMLKLCTDILKSGKHLATANKALLATHGDALFACAADSGRILAFEAAVCGAIPVIRTVRDGFSGDYIDSISGIMNGTSNYILSRMQEEDLSFDQALKLAQEAGYAEADPRLDIGGGDAGHKLGILMHLAFGLPFPGETLRVQGIQGVEKGDIRAAQELGCSIKLICHAKRVDGTVHASVMPMMVKTENALSRVNGATNAVRFLNRYSGEHILVGKGAGSLETGSAVVADILFIASYTRNASAGSSADSGAALVPQYCADNAVLRDLDDLPFPYTIIFDMEDKPGITGLVATAIGDAGINIDTVGHNLHGVDTAVFCVETMACTRKMIDQAIALMGQRRPGVFAGEPKIYPVLY